MNIDYRKLKCVSPIEDPVDELAEQVRVLMWENSELKLMLKRSEGTVKVLRGML